MTKVVSLSQIKFCWNLYAYVLILLDLVHPYTDNCSWAWGHPKGSCYGQGVCSLYMKILWDDILPYLFLDLMTSNLTFCWLHFVHNFVLCFLGLSIINMSNSSSNLFSSLSFASKLCLQNGRRPLLQLLHPNSSRYFSHDDLASLDLSVPSLCSMVCWYILPTIFSIKMLEFFILMDFYWI